MSTKQQTLDWTDLDQQAVDTVRVLAMDAVQKVGNGHPGTAMSLAPAAYLLFQRYLRHDPTDPGWLGPRPVRALLRPLQPDALHPALPVRLRPGARRPPGAAHVGLAHPGPPRARAHRRRRDHDRPARPGRRQRGRAWRWPPAASAACSTPTPPPARARSTTRSGASPPTATSRRASPARRPRSPAPSGSATSSLLYDDNHISIEDDTSIALSARTSSPATRPTAGTPSASTGSTAAVVRRERAGARRRLRGRPAGDRAPVASSRCARSSAGPRRTSRTPARPTARALGDDEVAATKKLLGFDPDKTFDVDPTRCSRTPARSSTAAASAHAEWDETFDRLGRGQHRAARRCSSGCRTGGCPTAGPRRCRRSRPTRRAWPPARRPARCSPRSRRCCPSCGAARPTSPSATTRRPRASRRSCPRTARPRSSPAARTAGCCTSASASTRWARSSTASPCTAAPAPYGGTFLVFSDYMRPAVRLAAIMKLPVTYVWTHDSIGLGEDGPTHQPVEHLAALRAIPGLDVVRPADANETAVAWRTILEHTDRPAGLVPDPAERPDLGPVGLRVRRGRRKCGGYVLADAVRRPAAGHADRHRLGGAARGRRARAARGRGHRRRASCRCRASSGSTQQDAGLPASGCSRPAVKARVSVEAARRAGLARDRRRRRRDRRARALRRQRRPHGALRAVRLHPRPRRRGRPCLARAGRRHHRHARRATDRRATICLPRR